MTVYERARYIQDVKQTRDMSTKLAFAPINQLQNTARSITAGEPPPGITKTVFHKPPENDALDALLLAIEGLKQDNERYETPAYVDVPSERVSPTKQGSDGLNIMYIHGGGFTYGSPGTARRMTKRLADQTGATVIAVQFRAATEQPFPGALLDIFSVYLSLLAPSKKSNIRAVSSKKLILAGESSGLNMIMALILVLLKLQHKLPAIRFHGQDARIELPAAIVGLSGFFDITCGLESWTRYAGWDVLPQHSPMYATEWKAEKAWPSDPPRADIYCERSAMTHQLVSPITAPNWTGAPPLFLACGEEMCLDSNLYLAKLAASQGVTVRFKLYEMMTHVWPSTMPKLPHSAHVIESIAAFVHELMSDVSIATTIDLVSFETMHTRPLDVSRQSKLTREEVLRKTAAARDARQIIRRDIHSSL